MHIICGIVDIICFVRIEVKLAVHNMRYSGHTMFCA